MTELTSFSRLISLLAVGLLAGALGCDERKLDEATARPRALSSAQANDAFGFESLADWTISAGTPTLVTSPRTEGQRALQLQGPTWYTTIISRPIALSTADLAPLSASGRPILLDLELPFQQPDSSWFGDVELFVSCPSHDIENAPVGKVPLTGKPLGTFIPLSFDASNIAARLLQGCSDFSLKIELSVPASGTGAYVFDNLRLGGASGNVPDAGASPPICRNGPPHVVDVHADFRDIWAGRETVEAGKQSDSLPIVVLDFSARIRASLVDASFVPVDGSGACGAAVQALVTAPPLAWVQTGGAEAQPYPAGYSAFVRGSLSDVSQADGPLAAGQTISLSSFAINGALKAPLGLVAGDGVALAMGSVSGNVISGRASTIPKSVAMGAGTASEGSPIHFADAFARLEALSRAVRQVASASSSPSTSGTVVLHGTEPGLNTFLLSAAALVAAKSVQIDVPPGAAVIVNVDGDAITFENAGVFVRGAGASSLLWNFPGAHNITLSRVDFVGSLLAPTASVVLKQTRLNGTIVAGSLTGGDSLRFARLDAARVLGSVELATVSLVPSQPLRGGCRYLFTVSSSRAERADGQCPSPDLKVTFQVAASTKSAASRELRIFAMAEETQTPRRFAALPGINTPVAEVWSRYADILKMNGDDLVALPGATVPSSLQAGIQQTYYRQIHRG
jgi:choice-of-anchor A domain-containing protein